MGATFKVIKVDPNGSGMDWSDSILGRTIINAKRCCKNCTVIFGDMDSGSSFVSGVGPFIIGELESLNEDAAILLQEVIKESLSKDIL